MKSSESIKNIAKSLSDFQFKVLQPKKSADNPFFKSKYVPLEEVANTVHKTQHEFGLSYVQTSFTLDGKPALETRVMHESGEWIESEPLVLKPDKDTPQGAGSAITYARRYQLGAMYGISSEVDDDGNEASGNRQNNVSKKSTNNHTEKSKQPTIEDVNKGILALQKDFKVSAPLAWQEIADYMKVNLNVVKDQPVAKLYRTVGIIYKNYKEMKAGLPHE